MDGSGNNVNQPLAGIPGTPFIRNPLLKPFYADAFNNLINTPGNYTAIPNITCSAALSGGTFPLPRCVSNKVASKQAQDNDMFNLVLLEK